MYQNKYVFAQLTDFLPYFDFHYIVKKHRGNMRIRDFSCWNQLLMMLFGQFSNCNSMRDLCILTDAHLQKPYRLGFGKSVALSTLSRANTSRDYRIYEEFASLMIAKTQKYRAGIDFDIQVDGKVYTFDSSTASLCLNAFWRATCKRQKGAIKLHTLYDIRIQIPDFIVVTPDSVNDVTGMDYIEYQTGSYYIFDRGYNDFARLYNIHNRKAFSIFRAREKIRFRRIYSIKKEQDMGIKSDQTGVFTTENPPKLYSEKIRRIRCYDAEQNRAFIFPTDDFTSSAKTITELYRKRWYVELFFKWIKQHLKIKQFWGTTENAVKIQVNRYCSLLPCCDSGKNAQNRTDSLRIITNFRQVTAR